MLPTVRSRIVTLVLASAVSGSGIAAQNLIQNGEFDTSLAQWAPLNAVPGSNAVWVASGFDGDFSAYQGSVRLDEYRDTGFDAFNHVSQCVSPATLPPALGFRAYAWASDGGNGAGVDAEAILQNFSGANCSGTMLREYRQATPAENRWAELWLSYSPPAGTKSVRVYLALVKRFPTTDHASGGFDDIFLGSALPAKACVRTDLFDRVMRCVYGTTNSR